MQIDKNIPIPKRGKSTADKYKHLNVFESWEIGDSVSFSAQQKTKGKDRRPNYSKEAMSFVNKAKKYGHKVVTRVVVEDNAVRVWRVE